MCARLWYGLIALAVCFSTYTSAALGDDAGLINLAPLAGVKASARMDGARDATNINDEDRGTYWSAWPYTMPGGEDVITLDVTLPTVVSVHRIEIDSGYVSPEIRLSVRSNGQWQPCGAVFSRPDAGPQFVWDSPVHLDALKFEYPRIRAEQSGVVVSELRIMGKLPASAEIISPLPQDETPELDWQPVTGKVHRRDSGGEPQNRWFEAELDTPQPVQRIEMTWHDADYARRTVLELVCDDGRRLFAIRQRFSTSFTFEKAYQVKCVRVHCSEVGQDVSLSDLRLFSSGTGPVPPVDPKVALWAESSLVKVQRHADKPGKRSRTLRIELAQNEYEGGQIVVKNNSPQVLRDVSILTGELRHDDGTTLPPGAISVNPVGWVNNAYADVLLPSGPFKVAGGEARPVWITVHADANASPGIYRGQASCRCAGKELGHVPIEVTVWDLALPRETHFDTHYFSIWGTDRWLRSALADPQRREQLLQTIADQFIRHRISPGTCFILEDYEQQVAQGTWSDYLAEFDRWTQKLIDGGLPFVGVLDGPRSGMKGGPTTEREYWQAIEKHLDEKGWLDRFSVRVGDEPPPGNQKVTNRAKQFIEWAPKLRRQCAFSSFGTNGTPRWTGLVNEWGISPRVYGEDRLGDVVSFCQERIRAGDGMAWYIHHPLSVEEQPYFPRMYLWYMWKHRIPGALLYGVAEWAHRDVDRWEDDFVIHGTGFKTWGVLLWPAEGRLLGSVRWEAVRDGIEDYELHLMLADAIAKAEEKKPGSPKFTDAHRVLDETDSVFVTFDSHEADKAAGYRIRDSHSPGPILCTNARPADLLNARRAIVEAIIDLRQTEATTRNNDQIPTWAKQYTEGLRAWRDIVYYWLDRQSPDGTFGFGWGEDCEMIVGWPGVMMAADDKRIEQAIEKLADNRWYNNNIQNGYVYLATEAEHGAEPISYTQPILLYQKFGSPKLIERFMVTAKNVEHWTAITPRGDRHMQSTYFGSQQMYDWPYYDEDSPINARTWLPMMHLLLYNRDPHLSKYFLEWTGAWAKHAMSDVYGKPPGILPGQVTFKTGEPGGSTKNWWGAGAHEFNTLWYHTRLHGMLVVAYVLTGDENYITPLREMMRFLSTYARPAAREGESLPPDRLPEKYTFPEGWRDGTASTQWARDVALGHPGCWYYYVTGDTQFDDKFARLLNCQIKRGPFQRIDKEIVESGYNRARQFRDSYFEKVVPKLKYAGSLANYAAAWWQKQYGTMTFGQRCFRDGGRLANSVNWPWVDFPPPAVVWKNTGYDTGIFVLEDAPQRFRVALCNVTQDERTIAAQLFTLDEGTYRLRFGPDADEDGSFDAVTRTDRIYIQRGRLVHANLPPRQTMILELERDPDSGPVPPWQPKPDLGLDPWDIMISKEDPSPGDQVTVTVRVHNIGSKPAENVRVLLLGHGPSGEQIEIARTDIERIDAPDKLVPSFVDTPFAWTVTAEIDQIGAVIDPADTIDELYHGNNVAWVKLADMKQSQPVKKFVQHEPAVKPSLADVDPTDLSRYDVPFRDGIKVDGLIGEQEWKEIEVFDFLPAQPDLTLKRHSRMQIAYDDDALYLALWCEEPNPDWLDTDLPRQTDIYYKDGFEIFLDPGAQVWRYWQFVFDTLPHQFQTLTRNQYAPKAKWDVAVHKGTDFYSAEVRFPLREFDVEPPKPGSRWRMNVMRYTTTFRDPDNPDRRISERSHFSPKGKLHSHHTPELFGDLYFKEKTTPSKQ